MPQPKLTFILDEPMAELSNLVRRVVQSRGVGVFVRGESVKVIDSSAYLHDEAALLDAEELTDAREALIEDRIFSRAEWMNDEVQLRAAVKYGWAVAHLETARANVGEMKVAWSVANGSETTTPNEWKFLTGEITRRSLGVSWISPCTPAHFEPAVDYHGEIVVLQEWFRALAACEAVRVLFPNAANKFTILPLLAQREDLATGLDLGRVGWMEVLRVTARTEPDLFRKILPVAQERFVFDKGPHLLSTTEEDVRSLPSVADPDLETTFLDDFRGRQLLHIGADSIVENEGLRSRLAAVVDASSDELERAIADCIQRHLELVRPS